MNPNQSRQPTPGVRLSSQGVSGATGPARLRFRWFDKHGCPELNFLEIYRTEIDL